MSRPILVAIGVLLLLTFAAVGGMIYLNQKASFSTKQSQMAAIKARDAEYLRKKQAQVNQEEEEKKKKKQEIDTLIKDPLTKKIDLTDVSKGKATGSVYLLRKNGKLTMYYYAQNVPNVQTIYEAWLVQKTPLLINVSMGKLAKQEDGSYTLFYSIDNTFDTYKTVMISSEKNQDGVPEKKILEADIQ